MTGNVALAEFSIKPEGDHRYSVKIGNNRVFDLVDQGCGLKVKYKPAKQDRIFEADLMQLMHNLALLLDLDESSLPHLSP